MRTFVLARHGESTTSVKRLINGDPAANVELTDKGKEQARRLGSVLAKVPIDLCVTSTFLRTKQTAEFALGDRDVARLVVHDLDDLRFGDFEGAPLSQYRDWYRRHGHAATPAGGGESRLQTVERFCRGLRAVLARDERNILVIAHGLMIAYVQAATTQHDLDLAPNPLPYAVPYDFHAAELEQALNRLEGWAQQRADAACT